MILGVFCSPDWCAADAAAMFSIEGIFRKSLIGRASKHWFFVVFLFYSDGMVYLLLKTSDGMVYLLLKTSNGLVYLLPKTSDGMVYLLLINSKFYVYIV